jgi:hypothetical protein
MCAYKTTCAPFYAFLSWCLYNATMFVLTGTGRVRSYLYKKQVPLYSLSRKNTRSKKALPNYVY